MRSHHVSVQSCRQPTAWQREQMTGCIAAVKSSDSVQGAKEGQDSAEGAAPPPREKSFSRSRSKDDRPMWETWILREAWDKGSLEVGAVPMSPLQSGSPDLLPVDSACCEAGWYCLDGTWPCHSRFSCTAWPQLMHRHCAEQMAAVKPLLKKFSSPVQAGQQALAWVLAPACSTGSVL